MLTALYIYLKRFAALLAATLQLLRILGGGGSLVGIYFVGSLGVSSTGPLILLAGMLFRGHAAKKGFFVDRHGLSSARGFIL